MSGPQPTLDHESTAGAPRQVVRSPEQVALDLPVDHGAPDHIRRFDRAALATRRIVTGEHCYGCTAGGGSSCGGALV